MRPLEGVRVVEFSSLGPVQHAGMLLVDLGAEVVQIERPGAAFDPDNPVRRGRRVLTLDLKSEQGRAEALEEISRSDVVIEGFRPGVLERLGLGPAQTAKVNPGVVFGRMTGWGQDGPLAHKAGHDINYIAETGALWAIRRRGAAPTVPLNVVGDNGGGSLYLVMGILAALHARATTNQGAVIDAAIVDGTTSLLETVRGLQAEGAWRSLPASNLLDSGAPFYDAYQCSDGNYMAVGAIEPQFYAQLLSGLGLAPDTAPDRDNPDNWPELRRIFTDRFHSRSREEWIKVFDPLDACVSPVWSLDEAASGPHLTARGTLRRTARGTCAASAPRFSPLPAPPTEDTHDQTERGFNDDDVNPSGHFARNGVR